MKPAQSRNILVAGAGIAGLTAALAFAARGSPVKIFERAPEFHEIGAGLQLSPNATRILGRLGVLGELEAVAVQPPAILLRDAASLRPLGCVPLGDQAMARWKAPYLVVHRADLQKALLAAVARHDAIRITAGATVRAFHAGESGIAATVDVEGEERQVHGLLAIGADGVWSRLRQTIQANGKSRFTGHLAWRRTLAATDPLARGLSLDRSVNAFLHPGFHLVAYPVQGGECINLVAFTPGADLPENWAADADLSPLRRTLGRAARPLAALVDDGGSWTAWPIHAADPAGSWTRAYGMALIGDAAHAMTPFSAQGAAMAIEDAETLAALVAARPTDIAAALAGWEALRRPRIARVAGRGAFNHFVWSAGGPVALARNLVLRLRPPEHLLADFDWLYGWDTSDAVATGRGPERDRR